MSVDDLMANAERRRELAQHDAETLGWILQALPGSRKVWKNPPRPLLIDDTRTRRILHRDPFTLGVGSLHVRTEGKSTKYSADSMIDLKSPPLTGEATVFAEALFSLYVDLASPLISKGILLQGKNGQPEKASE